MPSSQTSQTSQEASPRQLDQPPKRPSIGRGQSSSTIIGRSPIAHSPSHKAFHRPIKHVAGRHARVAPRNTSVNKDLHKLKSVTQLHNHTAEVTKHHRRSLSGETASGSIGSTQTPLKKNASTVAMSRNTSHSAVALKKNHSFGHLPRAASSKTMSKGKRPLMKRSTTQPSRQPSPGSEDEDDIYGASPEPAHPTVRFDLGNEEEEPEHDDAEEGWTEASGSASPEATRSNSASTSVADKAESHLAASAKEQDDSSEGGGVDVSAGKRKSAQAESIQDSNNAASAQPDAAGQSNGANRWGYLRSTSNPNKYAGPPSFFTYSDEGRPAWMSKEEHHELQWEKFKKENPDVVAQVETLQKQAEDHKIRSRGEEVDHEAEARKSWKGPPQQPELSVEFEKVYETLGEQWDDIKNGNLYTSICGTDRPEERAKLENLTSKQKAMYLQNLAKVLLTKAKNQSPKSPKAESRKSEQSITSSAAPRRSNSTTAVQDERTEVLPLHLKVSGETATTDSWQDLPSRSGGTSTQTQNKQQLPEYSTRILVPQDTDNKKLTEMLLQREPARGPTRVRSSASLALSNVVATGMPELPHHDPVPRSPIPHNPDAATASTSSGAPGKALISRFNESGSSHATPADKETIRSSNGHIDYKESDAIPQPDSPQDQYSNANAHPRRKKRVGFAQTPGRPSSRDSDRPRPTSADSNRPNSQSGIFDLNAGGPSRTQHKLELQRMMASLGPSPQVLPASLPHGTAPPLDFEYVLMHDATYDARLRNHFRRPGKELRSSVRRFHNPVKYSMARLYRMHTPQARARLQKRRELIASREAARPVSARKKSFKQRWSGWFTKRPNQETSFNPFTPIREPGTKVYSRGRRARAAVLKERLWNEPVQLEVGPGATE